MSFFFNYSIMRQGGLHENSKLSQIFLLLANPFSWEIVNSYKLSTTTTFLTYYYILINKRSCSKFLYSSLNNMQTRNKAKSNQATDYVCCYVTLKLPSSKLSQIQQGFGF